MHKESDDVREERALDLEVLEDLVGSWTGAKAPDAGRQATCASRPARRRRRGGQTRAREVDPILVDGKQHTLERELYGIRF